jgi:MerR family copper efflux transcriptional regulator
MTAEVTTLMTVGELSRQTRVPIKALRAYTDWGLINTLGRSGANYRLYDDEALRCVQIITEMRGLGLTLAEIRSLALACPDRNGQLIGPRLAQRLRAARARVEQQIVQLEKTRRRIDAFEAAHHGELAGQRGAELWGAEPLRCASCA